MNVPRNYSQQCQADVDEEIGAAARNHEYADGRQEDRDEDYKDGGGGVCHCDWFWFV